MKFESGISETLQALLNQAIHDGLASSISLSVRSRKARYVSLHVGKFSRADEAPATKDDALYDLASLTKPLAAASLCALLKQEGALRLDDTVASLLPDFQEARFQSLRIRDLLQHGAGFADWRDWSGVLQAAEDPIKHLGRLLHDEQPVYEPRTKSLYSDLGYMLLDLCLRQRFGEDLSTRFAEGIAKPLDLDGDLCYSPQILASPEALARTVHTDHPQGQTINPGEVHDANARALGGVALHAGLFGTAKAVECLALEWLRAYDGENSLFRQDTVQDFWLPYEQLPNSDFVLGFDRPVWKTSTAGRHATPHTVGHLGFTGTSVWIDPDKDLIVTLLTNRVHCDTAIPTMRRFRQELHTRLYELLGKTGFGPYGERPDKDTVRRIHFIGVAGTGMGSLAGLMKQAGYEVSGSDENVYPPMSDVLAEQKIPVMTPFDPKNLEPAPDLCVVGNVCTRRHIEVTHLRRKGLAYDSLAGTLERLYLMDRHPLVVAGTHGKTTTTSLLAYLLHDAGMDPGFFIGGRPANFGAGFRAGGGPFFVVEGDEYDSAYFEKQPKFMRYRPKGAILTSIEFDHADIYDSLDEIRQAFLGLVKLIPRDGVLFACIDHEAVRGLLPLCQGTVRTYGESPDAEFRAVDLDSTADGTAFTLVQHGQALGRLRIPLFGRHNVLNSLAACGLLLDVGLDLAQLAQSLPGFLGVDRRQQVKGVESGVRVVDDFAHHPTAIHLTLEGMRKQYPTGSLWAVFDPRTNTTSRNFFQKELPPSFESADAVIFGPPSRQDRIPPAERLNPAKVVEDLQAMGKKAYNLTTVDEMVALLAEKAKPGDTVAVLSNGGFGGIHQKLLDALKSRR